MTAEAELRTPLAVLNERSLPAQSAQFDEDWALDLVAKLAAVVRAARALRPDLTLVSSVGLPGYPLTPDGTVTFGALANRRGGRARDEWLSLLQALNRAPFTSLSDRAVPQGDREYLHKDEAAVGLGFAHATGQLAVSLAVVPWLRREVTITLRRLEEAQGSLVDQSVTVRHAATTAHVRQHDRAVREAALPDDFDGAHLWADRSDLYPCLAFLPSVEANLKDLPSMERSQVHKKLTALNEACDGWEASRSAPVWGGHVTPEAQGRKKLCMFADIDGQLRCFDLHARYTPNEGRIHFRLTTRREARRAIVAYIGPKLGV